MKSLTIKSGLSIFLISLLLIEFTGCAPKPISLHRAESKRHQFISEQYHHFENGVLFTDIEMGLTMLWEASFKYGSPYKENMGLFVPGGLLILPNKNNTLHSSRFSLLRSTRHDTLFVDYQGSALPVLGIVHTHPDDWGVKAPTSRSDYQYGYLGIHNYIITEREILDAYYDLRGDEVFDHLGLRNSITHYFTPAQPIKAQPSF